MCHLKMSKVSCLQLVSCLIVHNGLGTCQQLSPVMLNRFCLLSNPPVTNQSINQSINQYFFSIIICKCLNLYKVTNVRKKA